MKVTIINTSDAGTGAGVAAMRLLKALTSENIKVTYLAQHKTTASNAVHTIVKNSYTSLIAKLNFYIERIPFILFKAKNKSVRFAFSTADVGTDISKQTQVLDADILHIHWTNSGFLSLKNLQQLIALGKPIVWTLHDMWVFTGGCHYAGDCNNFTEQCGDCYFLKNPNPKDISHTGWLSKHKIFDNAKNLSFVTCSSWLKTVAEKSSLIKHLPIQAIANPIDTNVFKPKDRNIIRKEKNINPESKIILFGAANINDRRKGVNYFIDALNHLKGKNITNIEIAIFGKNKHFNTSELPFPVHEFGIISGEKDIIDLYNLADLFVMPSIEDNLPNTVMESLACSTPVVAFNTGGLPEMIEHQQNGYLAEYKNALDLASGMEWFFNKPNQDGIRKSARQGVLNNFNERKIADDYIKLYKSLIH